MRLKLTLFLTALAGLMVGTSTPSAAQYLGDRRIVVTPWAGYFMPATDVAGMGDAGAVNPGLGLKQQAGLALGLNTSYWMNNRFGIEVGGFYAFSDAKGITGTGGGVPGFPAAGKEDAYVLAGSAKLMYNLIPFTERSALRLGLGPAVIRRDGKAFNSKPAGAFSGLTDWGAAISLCTRLPLTEVISLRVRAEDYLYRSQLRFWDGTNVSQDLKFDARIQNDLVFSAGLQMVFWR